MKLRKNTVVLVLDNIRSAHNVGSIFRTADAASITKIILAGVTPTPIDRFGRKRKDIVKASLGAEETVSWEYAPDPLKIIQNLKQKNFFIISIEQTKKALDYKKVKVQYPVLFVVGNEISGISPEILQISDVVAKIPMHGTKESLNVSVATGIALFRMLTV